MTSNGIHLNGIKEAVEKLRHALKSDADYWQAWKSNIAVCFQDEYRGLMKDTDIHSISNKAAERFLNLLTAERAPDSTTQGAEPVPAPFKDDALMKRVFVAVSEIVLDQSVSVPGTLKRLDGVKQMVDELIGHITREIQGNPQ